MSPNPNEEEEVRKSRGWNPVGIVILVFALVLGVGVLAVGIITVWQFQERTMLRVKESQEVSDARQMVLACRSYAADHEEGKFPPALEVLYPDYLDVEGLFKTADGEPRWHYGPGLTDDSSFSRKVLLWSREPVGGKRWVVVYAGGNVGMEEREPVGVKGEGKREAGSGVR